MAEAEFQASSQASTIQYGLWNDENAAHTGKTIAELRAQYGKMWMIPPDAVPHKGKEAMAENYTLKPGDTIVWIKKLGEKG